jgi:sRNA-binding protein
MSKLIWIGAAVVGLLTASAAGACDAEHQTTAQQQEQKPQKKVAAKKAAKKPAAKKTVAQNEKS